MMDYSEAGDRYIDEILTMKRIKDLEEMEKRAADFVITNKKKIDGYDTAVKIAAEAVQRQRTVDVAAAEILSQAIDDIGKDHPKSKHFLTDQEYSGFVEKTSRAIDKKVREITQPIVEKNEDTVFQRACVREAESTIAILRRAPIDEFTEQKIRYIRDACNARPYQALVGKWTISCTGCLDKHTHDLDAEKVKKLLADGYLTMTVASNVKPVRFHCPIITLPDLIEEYLQSTWMKKISMQLQGRNRVGVSYGQDVRKNI